MNVGIENCKLKIINSRQRRAGFTLLEILVSLAILSIIFSIGYVSYRDFAQRQEVTSAVRGLKGDLRLAQELALAGKKPDDVKCNPPNVLDGYNFKVSSTTAYALEAFCSGGIVTLKTVNLQGKIAISSPSPNPITFKILGQGNNVTLPTTITVSLTGTSVSPQTLTITRGGEIK